MIFLFFYLNYNYFDVFHLNTISSILLTRFNFNLEYCQSIWTTNQIWFLNKQK